jgi:hypothetical protein
MLERHRNTEEIHMYSKEEDDLDPNQHPVSRSSEGVL